IMTQYSGSSSTYPGIMTIVRNDVDTGSYALLDQTPYNDGSADWTTQLQNISRNRNIQFAGKNILTSGPYSFGYINGMTLWLSFSTNFIYSTAGDPEEIEFIFEVNGEKIHAVGSIDFKTK